MRKHRFALALIFVFSSALAHAVDDELPDLVEKHMIPGVVNISSTNIVKIARPGWEDFLNHWGFPSEVTY
jgi:hypothetical protein